MWWYSQDEERWNGPCETREEAIAEGRGQYDDEGFMVCEAEQGEYKLNCGAYRIIDWIDEENCDLTDPDGDGVFGDISKEACDDLDEMIKATIRAWATKHKLHTRAFMFTKQSKIENIPSEDDECTCSERFAGPTDTYPPEGKIRNKNCPVHGIDPDAAREAMQDKA